MELRKFIATTIREYLNEQQEVDSNLVKNYTFDIPENVWYNIIIKNKEIKHVHTRNDTRLKRIWF